MARRHQCNKLTYSDFRYRNNNKQYLRTRDISQNVHIEQWECRSTGIDACREQKSYPMCCWFHDFLLRIGYYSSLVELRLDDDIFFFKCFLCYITHLYRPTSKHFFLYILILVSKVWSFFCFNSAAYFCCYILCPFCIYRYVVLIWIVLIKSHACCIILLFEKYYIAC